MWQLFLVSVPEYWRRPHCRLYRIESGDSSTSGAHELLYELGMHGEPPAHSPSLE